ncbi:MAG TPA: mannosyltransferase family protein [Luteitalea sp.]|nr:mannosyltransferase family protein [Luteitalea sp.]
MTSISAPAQLAPRPVWVRLIDVFITVTMVLLVSAVLTGGLRVRFNDIRVTAESPEKIAPVLAVLLLVRTWFWRRDTWWGNAAAWLARVWRDATLRRVFPWVVVTRLTLVYITYLAVIVIGYPEGAPPFRMSSNEFRNLFGRWDAGWYIGIAESGYNYWGNLERQTNVAFFPAYPFAMRTAAGLLGARWGSPESPEDSFHRFTERRHVRLLHAGWLVSVVAFTGGLIYLFRLARDMTDSDEAAAGAVSLAATYPFAFFYGAVYTEGLFLLCATAAVYHFRRREWHWAALAGLVAGLSRPNGCLLSVPLGIMALALWRRDGYRWQTLALALPTAACAGIGMLAFTTWLYTQTGEWFLWMKAHGAWGRQFSGVHLLAQQRWRDFQGMGLYGYSVVHSVEILNMAATFLVVGVSWPLGRRFGWAWSAFLLVTVLPPLFMGGFLSMGRVTSTMFPMFIYLGWRARGMVLQQMLLVGFGLQVALAIMHFTWRQVY